MDSCQIFTNAKDLQVLLVGGPKLRPANPRWQTAAISKNRQLRNSLTDFD